MEHAGEEGEESYRVSMSDTLRGSGRRRDLVALPTETFYGARRGAARGRYRVSCTTRMPCRSVMRAAGQRATLLFSVLSAAALAQPPNEPSDHECGQQDDELDLFGVEIDVTAPPALKAEIARRLGVDLGIEVELLQKRIAELRSRISVGGVPEAVMRGVLSVGLPRGSVDERGSV
jgi:hypothetical protein